MNNIPSVRFYSLNRDPELSQLFRSDSAPAENTVKDLLSQKFNVGKDQIKLDLREPGNPLGIIETKA